MEFSIATLLANFTNDKLIAAKVLEKKLDCGDESSLQKLHIVLDVLEKIGILSKDLGKYRRLREQDTIEAKLRCSSKGFCFAIQEGEETEDIYIRESHLSSAWNGDRVLVKMTKEGSRRRSPEGEVRLILERANHSLLARVKQVNQAFRAIPLDDRLLFEIELEENGHNLAEAIDHLIHVEIKRYPLGQIPPIGRVVQILGSDAEAASDVDLVSCKHDLPRTFPAAVLAAAANLPTQIKKPDLKQRIDLRSLLTISFAPATSDTQQPETQQCIENAFTLQKTAAGQWQLGIHLADVAYYIAPESALDKEAFKRGSCVYLGEMVLPMLPDAVIERCSLVPQSDRLTLSVLLTIDSATGQLVEFEIQPSVINVDRQLSESQIAAILSGQIEDSHDLSPEVVQKLEQLSALSQAVKQLRSSRGSFEIKLLQRHYPYYDEGPLGAIVASESLGRDAKGKSLLTELLVLANQVVATHLQALAIPTVYRTQAPPDLEDVQEMIKLANNLGVELGLEQQETVQPADFQRFISQFAQSPNSEQVLTYLLQATLKNAVYSPKAGSYFGLALENAYTRCNAPLRRYADLLIQRTLHLVFAQGRDRRTTRAKEGVNLHHSSAHGSVNWNVLPPDIQQEIETDLARVVLQLNDSEKEVQDAEEDLEGLQKAQLMKQRTGEVFEGLITGVQSYGFFVEITVPDSNGRLLRVEGLVHVSSLKDDWYEYRARQQALFGRKNRASYRLGDRVSVQVKSVDYYRQQIDLVTVNDNNPTGTEKPEEFNDEANQVDFGDSESYLDEE